MLASIIYQQEFQLLCPLEFHYQANQATSHLGNQAYKEHNKNIEISLIMICQLNQAERTENG